MKIGNILSDFVFAIRSIYSHKRRSLATGAGLILGVAILSNVFFYGGMLNVIAIQDIIESPAGDVFFTPSRPLTSENISEVTQTIETIDEVQDSTFFYGVLVTYYYGQIFPFVIDSDYNGSLDYYLFSKENAPAFVVTTIPDEELENNQIPGVDIAYGTNDLSGNGCLLSINARKNYNIKINDTLNLNFVIVNLEEMEKNNDSNYILASMSLSCVVRGFFYDNRVYQSNTIIIASHNVNEQLIETMENNSLFGWSVKLDYSKLPVNNMNNLRTAIKSVRFEIEQSTHGMVYGIDLVSTDILVMQTQNIIMQIVNAVLYIPAIILSLMLVGFGTELALQERKYEVAVFKAMGASPKQIRRGIMTEVLIIGLIGEAIGVMLGIVGAAVVISSYTFLSVDMARFGEAVSSVRITPFGLIFPIVITLGIVLIQSIKKTNTFLAQEVALSRQIEKKKIGWFKRIYGDVMFFVLGLIGVTLNVVQDINPSVSYGFWPMFIQFIAPLTLWYGSAGVVSRIATKVPEILDKYIIKMFKDIGLLFKGSLARRHQNFPRVTVMITLAISLSFLAAIQGETSLQLIQRQADYTTGGDMYLEISTNSLVLDKSNFTTLQDKIEVIIPIYSATLFASSMSVTFYGADLDIYGHYALWHKDCFVGTRNWQKALDDLSSKPTSAFAINKMGERYLQTKEDPFVEINLPGDTVETITAEALYTFDHAPGAIGATPEPVALVHKDFLLTHAKNETAIIRAIVILKPGVDPDKENLSYQFNNYTFVSDAYTYNEIYTIYKKAQARYFGIPGLLTIDYTVAILTSIIGVFIFMFTIINRRKQEFAILISEGASSGQIIRLVFSEILSIAVFATLFGSLIGFLLGYQFNGFFKLFSTTFMNRSLAFPVITLVVSVAGSFIAIIGAALLPAIAATKVKVVEEMRVL